MIGRFPSGAPGPRRPSKAQIEAMKIRVATHRACLVLDMAEASDNFRRAGDAMAELAETMELLLDENPYIIEPDEA